MGFCCSSHTWPKEGAATQMRLDFKDKEGKVKLRKINLAIKCFKLVSKCKRF